MIEYKSWSTIPETLATKAALRKRGLKPAKGQQPTARKIGGYQPYDLYLVVYAVPIRKTSEAQLATLAKARDLVYTALCRKCGKRVDKDLLKKGHCYACDQSKDKALMTKAAEEASAWARAMLAKGALILDTETTGLDDEAEIVQIAIIDTNGTTLLNSLVMPTQFSATYHIAEAIHGISREMLANAPTMMQLWPQVLAILDHATNLVIYNRDFDLRLLMQSAPRNEWRAPHCATHCAMLHYAKFVGQWSKHHKSFRWQPLFGGDHTALGDCLATLNLLRQMANEEKTEGGDVPTNQLTN